MPLTPSPQTTPKSVSMEAGESIHHGNVNLTSRFSRAQSKTNVRDSPKSNIARRSPRNLDITSDFTLSGTGPRPASSARNTPSRPKSSRSGATVRTPKRSQGRIDYTAADRFIPNRDASGAISSEGAAIKLGNERTPGRRPKSSASDGSATLAAGVASAFDIGRHSTSDTTLSLEGLNLNDNEDSTLR